MHSSRRSPPPGCALTRRRRCFAMVMPGCGGCSARRCRRLRSCWIGGMSLFVSSTRCRWHAVSARVRRTQILSMTRFITWSVRNGACGTADGPGAGVNLLAYTAGRSASKVAGIDRLRRHIGELLGYLERNEDMLVHYAAQRRRGEPISTAFVESAVNEIVAKRMNKKQQMRWNRTTVQPFLDVRTAVLNDALEDAFRHRYPGFRSDNDDQVRAVGA